MGLGQCFIRLCCSTIPCQPELCTSQLLEVEQEQEILHLLTTVQGGEPTVGLVSLLLKSTPKKGGIADPNIDPGSSNSLKNLLILSMGAGDVLNKKTKTEYLELPSLILKASENVASF